MKFDELDNRLRIYETAHDFCVPPHTYMIARVDGRGFTRLTKETHAFERPFDVRFRDMMVETTVHLMNCGFKVLYAYTESDEISLLFDPNEQLFSRKLRKYNSVIAGEASAKFSLLLGDMGVFDCRISQLPRKQDVVDYFRWRNEDAHRNALSAHCYWFLREQGEPAQKATQLIDGKSSAEKNEFLFSQGINFNDLPNWQKRGIGFYWVEKEKMGWNPVKDQAVPTIRKEIQVNYDLPKGEVYHAFLAELLDQTIG